MKTSSKEVSWGSIENICTLFDTKLLVTHGIKFSFNFSKICWCLPKSFISRTLIPFFLLNSSSFFLLKFLTLKDSLIAVFLTFSLIS